MMLNTSAATLAMFLTATPIAAQQLSVTGSPPLTGDLLIHSGVFSAQRSTVGGGHCPEDGTGRRQQISEVIFDPPYRESPMVFVTLNSFDLGTGRNARIGARAENVTPGSMTLVVWTWCNTNLFAAHGSYFAMGSAEETLGGEGADPLPLPGEQSAPATSSEPEASEFPTEW